MSSLPVNSASEFEQEFLDHLPLIERLTAGLARQHAILGSDADDFSSWMKERLIDDGYGVFRKFGRRSRLSTYLSAVLVNLARDYRNAHWGRWRPSAAAMRLGSPALELERLLHRDGYSLREACEILRASDPSLRDKDLARLALQFPMRGRAAEISLDAAIQSGWEPAVDERKKLDREEELRIVGATLMALIEKLSDEDTIIVKMCFWDGLTVAAIARTLRLDQRALYTRLELIREQLRAELEARGIDEARALDLLRGRDE